jgi:Tfp pilus assembly protein PilF
VTPAGRPAFLALTARINIMHPGPIRWLRTLLLGSSVITGALAATTQAQDAKRDQPAPKAADSLPADLVEAAGKVREGRIDDALASIKRESAKHPEWSPPRLILARLMLSAGQGAPARLALERAAIETPEHPEIYLTLGTLALSDSRFSDARLNFEHALSLLRSAGGDPEKFKSFRRESHAGLAAAAEARDDWKSAERHLNSLLADDPKNGPARQRLGRVLFRLDKPDDAYAAFNRGVKDYPSLEPAAVSMAWLYSQKGENTKAAEWFDYAQNAAPENARVRMARAAWLLELGKAAAARPEIDAAVKLDPKLADAQRLRAVIAWHLRDLAATEQILEPLHHDAPTDSSVANLLALALLEQDDQAKRSRGQKLAEVNALQFPRSHEVVATLGWALYRAGRLNQAEQKLRAAVSGVRTTPDIAYFLARVLADKGQIEDAKKLVQSAIKLPGAFAHRSDADALLKSLIK